MIRFASILLLMLTSATLCAQEPPAQLDEAKIVLAAPSTARVGELVRFDVSQSVADSFKWLVVPQTSETDFEAYAEGRKAVFSARMPGDYVFIVAAAKNGSVDVIRWVLTVKGPPPMPQTDSLAEWIPFWGFTYNLPAAEARLLADSFEKTASRDDLEDAKAWMEATAQANRDSLGAELPKWIPLLDKIGEALLKKAQDGSLSTPEQHKDMWLEIASGLRNI